MKTIVSNYDHVYLTELLTKIFGTSANIDWLVGIAKGSTTIYDNGYGVINVSSDKLTGFLIILSATINNQKFTVEMLKDIKHLLITQENVILQSTKDDLASIHKYGMVKKDGYYIKGGTTKWV